MILPDDNFWKVFRATDGALSCSEAIAIMNVAAIAPHGNYLEMGTFKGKSAMSAAYVLKKGEFVLLEPMFAEKDFDINLRWATQGELLVKPIASYSEDYLSKVVYDMYAYVFSDAGSHQDGLPLREVKLLEDRIVSGGIIGFHDFRSQFCEVEGAYNYLLGTGKYEEVPIPWEEINKYVLENNLEEGNQTWHHTELATPNFFGALRRK
jgi:hypothetical protein